MLHWFGQSKNRFQKQGINGPRELCRTISDDLARYIVKAVSSVGARSPERSLEFGERGNILRREHVQ